AVHVPPRERDHPAALVLGSRFEKLREVVALLRARGCKVALVEVPPSPYLQELNPVLHGPGLPAAGGRPARPGFRQRMQELADELDLTFVPRDSRAAGLGNEAYLDVNHLTEAGARRFTTLLVQDLIAAGFFEP
ncbi:MAG TPA: SGNH/GDSL hydrolase family protein, partial [Planctomycetota bacterium]|nr:SGNH/GDSL hydrolase family protein [Planctomycetota bacterium]